MVQKIYKYQLPTMHGEVKTIPLPVGYQILKVGFQYGMPFMWVKFDAFNENNTRDNEFLCVWTGQLFPETRSYHVGTIVTNEVVLHFYEMG